MISLTKFDGSRVVINADWIQSIAATPDTVITLTSGFQILVKDKVDEVIKAFKDYKREQFGSVKVERGN